VQNDTSYPISFLHSLRIVVYINYIFIPVQEPYVELFLWAILTKKAALIDFFWYRCGEPVLMAIVAAAIYSKLGLFYSDQSQNREVRLLKGLKNVFLERANQVTAL
jgi:hypothetical protein